MKRKVINRVVKNAIVWGMATMLAVASPMMVLADEEVQAGSEESGSASNDNGGQDNGGQDNSGAGEASGVTMTKDEDGNDTYVAGTDVKDREVVATLVDQIIEEAEDVEKSASEISTGQIDVEINEGQAMVLVEDPQLEEATDSKKRIDVQKDEENENVYFYTEGDITYSFDISNRNKKDAHIPVEIVIGAEAEGNQTFVLNDAAIAAINTYLQEGSGESYVVAPGDSLTYDITVRSESGHIYRYKDNSFVMEPDNFEAPRGGDKDNFFKECLSITFGLEDDEQNAVDANHEIWDKKGTSVALQTCVADYMNDTLTAMGMGEEFWDAVDSGFDAAKGQLAQNRIQGYITAYEAAAGKTGDDSLTAWLAANPDADDDAKATQFEAAFKNYYSNDRSAFKKYLPGSPTSYKTLCNITKARIGGSDYALYVEQVLANTEGAKGAKTTINEYFNTWFNEGLSARDAAKISFMMGIDFDGLNIDNPYQDMVASWYNAITLYQADGDLAVHKRDAETGEAVEGAGFALWKIQEEGDTSAPEYFYGEPETDANGNTYYVGVFMTEEQAGSKPAVLYTDANGDFFIRFLDGNDNGDAVDYILSEIVTPDGYITDTSEFDIVIRAADNTDITLLAYKPAKQEEERRGGGGSNKDTEGTTIYDELTPLSNTFEIPDEETPLANTIEDEPTPLANVPQTGDNSVPVFPIGLAGVIALLASCMIRKKEN